MNRLNLTVTLAAAVLLALPLPPLAHSAGADETGPDGAFGGVPLIPRRTLFGNPDRAAPRISPDGKHLAWLAAVQDVLNVWVAPADNLSAAKPVTQEKTRGIRSFQWAYTNQHIIYTQDTGGDENWRVLVTDIQSGATKDLTPFDSIKGPDGKPMVGPDKKPLKPAARIGAVSHRFPSEIIIGLNNRRPDLHDFHRVNILTGEMKMVQENTGYVGYVVDDDYQIRLAVKMTPDGGQSYERSTPDGKWAPFMTVPPADSLTTNPVGFDKSGRTLFLIDSRNRDTAALVSISMDDPDRTTTLAADPRADAGDALVHPTENTVQAVSFEYERRSWKTLDQGVDADFAMLRKTADGDFNVVSRTLDDQTWIVAFTMDNGPVRYYRYNRGGHKPTFLFTNRTALEGLRLARMKPAVIKSRDGLELVSYYSLPPWTDSDGDGRPAAPLPMVLLVHGGPWGRDSWGFSSLHQLLANRGYAVLSVNFRGSTGLGKRFTNAGNREWSRKMHTYLLDAVDWAVKQKIADPAKVAIMGGSYGGYATLVGLTFTPDTFACGVDIVGPSNIITLLNTIPEYWKPMLDMFKTRVGDHRTEEGRKFLTECSPLSRVDQIKKPLLIGQGANDPRVKQSESDQIVKAMTDKKIPVTYVLFPDEGHGFARPPNNMAFYAVTEAFLSQHLGGRYEPVGDDFNGSTIKVPTGAEAVPGLKDALAKRGNH